MFQQKPTRIELKLDDMSEYKAKRKEQEMEKKTAEPSSTQTPGNFFFTISNCIFSNLGGLSVLCPEIIEKKKSLAAFPC